MTVGDDRSAYGRDWSVTLPAAVDEQSDVETRRLRSPTELLAPERGADAPGAVPVTRRMAPAGRADR